MIGSEVESEPLSLPAADSAAPSLAYRASRTATAATNLFRLFWLSDPAAPLRHHLLADLVRLFRMRGLYRLK